MKKVFKGMARSHAQGLKKHCLSLAICLSAGLFTAQATQASPNVSPPTLKAGAPHVYVVKKGDTLWDISGKFLRTPWRWKEIWASNKHVKNPHWIYPGDRLLLCTLDGRPLIGKDEGDGCEGVIRRHRGEISLKPQIRIESEGASIPVIPLSDISIWLNHSVVVDPNSLPNTPYIVGAADKRVISAEGQTVYARGNGIVAGQIYGVYRENDPYFVTDAAGKKVMIGRELTEVATATAVSTANDISTLELTKSYNSEVRRSDYVLPKFDVELPTMFYPTTTSDVQPNGRIIRVMGSISTGARYSVVTIDRGTTHGAKVGHVMSIYQEGEVVRDPKTNEKLKLPNERVGTLMIFKTFDQLSYAYVLESALPIKVGAELEPSPTTDN